MTTAEISNDEMAPVRRRITRWGKWAGSISAIGLVAGTAGAGVFELRTDHRSDVLQVEESIDKVSDRQTQIELQRATDRERLDSVKESIDLLRKDLAKSTDEVKAEIGKVQSRMARWHRED